jgi:hypothetical protein
MTTRTPAPPNYHPNGTNSTKQNTTKDLPHPLRKASRNSTRRMYCTERSSGFVCFQTGRILSSILHHVHQVSIPSRSTPLLGTYLEVEHWRLPVSSRTEILPRRGPTHTQTILIIRSSSRDFTTIQTAPGLHSHSHRLSHPPNLLHHDLS